MIIDKPAPAPVPAADEKAAVRMPVQPEPEPALDAVPEERELPPPYAEGSRPPASRRHAARDRENSVFQPTLQQHVNSVSLYSRNNDISGTYIIDPELPGHLQTMGRTLKKAALMRNNITPNASFETRRGAISLNLATAGGTDVPNKTYVHVESRHGRVNVNLFALQANKHIFLEVHTRKTPIVLLIPPNFEGALNLHSRSANVTFLPAFAQRARVVSADDRGSHILFGTGTLALVEPTSEGLDFCAVSSRHGKITVGVSGVDQLEAASEGGLMKKLGALVLGPEIMRTVDVLQNGRSEQILAHFASRR